MFADQRVTGQFKIARLELWVINAKTVRTGGS
jgi:hypothetical protein